jgi:hypothetical protein
MQHNFKEEVGEKGEYLESGVDCSAAEKQALIEAPL